MNKSFFNAGVSTTNAVLNLSDKIVEVSLDARDATQQGALATKDAGTSFWAGVKHARAQRAAKDNVMLLVGGTFAGIDPLGRS